MDACNATTLVQGWLNDADHMERAAIVITNVQREEDATDYLSDFLQDNMRDTFPAYALDMLYEAIESLDLAELVDWIMEGEEE